jgi:iron only hydrogenase large subunit-like protein
MTAPNPRHAVLLDESACKGCTVCITRCPVEAIRVRKGKASIIAERCIDCGVCVRICPNKAKRVDSDPLSMLSRFDGRIALPAPAFYAQFEEAVGTERVDAALLSFGFDGVVEVAEAAEIVAAAVRMDIEGVSSREDRPSGEERPRRKPLISSSCPAVVRLVQVRFPSLIDHLIRVLSPMEVAARLAKRRYGHLDRGGGIGVFFISPCPAKVTAARSPLGHERSAVDGVLAIKDLYVPIRQFLAGAPVAVDKAAESVSTAERASMRGSGERKTAQRASSFRAGPRGVAWARSEGESESLGIGRTIAADGMDRVIELLDAIENGALGDVDYVEALACPGGCVGGPLVVENPSLARSRVRALEEIRGIEEVRRLNGKGPTVSGWGSAREPTEHLLDLSWTGDIFSRPVYRLDEDYETARTMLEDMEGIVASLPGLDCGSCGAPSCRALAEDIVRGTAAKTDCIFILRERLRDLTKELLELEAMEPPSLDK